MVCLDQKKSEIVLVQRNKFKVFATTANEQSLNYEQTKFQKLFASSFKNYCHTPVTLSPNEHESDRIGRNANSG